MSARKGVPKSPEHCNAISKALTGRSLTLEHRAAISKSLKDVPKSPKHNAAVSKSLTGIPLSPEHRDAISKAHTGVPLSPETCAAMSISRKGVPKSPEHCVALSIALRNSEAIDAMRGGNDIVNHHYIYDHSDLSLNTVEMTRSDHGKLHKLLQKLKYIIPHINIKEE